MRLVQGRASGAHQLFAQGAVLDIRSASSPAAVKTGTTPLIKTAGSASPHDDALDRSERAPALDLGGPSGRVGRGCLEFRGGRAGKDCLLHQDVALGHFARDNGGSFADAQVMAHESPCTTKLYDRTKVRLTLDEAERTRL